MSWEAAGGDPHKLALFGRLAKVEGIVAGGGRVLASVNPAHEPTGALGDFTGDGDTLAAGENWLREQGCHAVQGPLDVATWFSYRANLGPHDEAPFFGEPLASPEPWLAAGYREVARYASALCANSEAIAYGDTKRPQDGVSFRSMRSFEQDLPVIHRLVLASFRDAYAYSPLPLEIMAALYAPIEPYMVPELVLIAEQAGEPIGFVFGVPDLLAPKSGRFLVKTLAVLPEYRRGGTGAWLVGELHKAAAGLGFSHGVHALMWAGSRSRSISAHGGHVFREYALYMKAL